MLRAMSGTAPSGGQDEAAEAAWIDLDRPDEAERARTAGVTGLRVPDRHEIEEIESSSRLVKDGQILRLSTPMLNRAADGALAMAPIGFVLTPDRLVTLRFAASTVFDGFAAQWRAPAGSAPSGLQPFLGLLEAIVDRLADVLEQIGAEADALSAAVFARAAETGGSSRARDRFLQATLSDIGRRGGRISQLRDGLLGIGRIARFVPEAAADWLDDAARHRLASIERDVASLSDYDAQLNGKIQFLLDATLGFISIEQNNTIKVLTVVSIVGIPPTFIASLYGMNFHNMPELSWTYGYQYGLGLILLSIAVPLVIFWRKGWL